MQFASAQNKFRGWLLVFLILLLGNLDRLHAANLSLSWAPSPDPTIIGYNAYYGTVSGSYSNQIAVGNNTTVVISNLNCGDTYYFAVTALDSNGAESGFSDEIQFIVPGLLTLTPGLQSGDPALIKFPVAPEHWYEVQATTDLKSWDTIWQTELATSNEWVQCSDSHASEFPARFYRLVSH